MSATKTSKKNSKGVTTDEIYQRVTDTIIAQLEKGTIPWQRPWKGNSAMHTNLKSKKAYRGINPFLLDLAAMDGGYSSPYWVTFKQGTEMGGTLKKIKGATKGTGQKATMVVFWKIMRIKTDELDDKGQPRIKTIPLLKYYNVFNVEQFEGFEDKVPQMDKVEFNSIEIAQALIDNMPEAPAISHGGNSAFYRPATDSVTLPTPESFDTPEAYYATAYHELVHATGHESRVGRIKDWATFGSEPYAKEELVAEMGAAMLSGFADIDMPVRENSAAYIASWLKALKDDHKLVVGAAGQAQKAADYIIGPEDAPNA